MGPIYRMSSPYREIFHIPNKCDLHIIWSDDFLNLGFSTSLYLPRCNECGKHVDVQGAIIGRSKMLKEMELRH